jgi:flagellar motor switch protein FliN/FliY
MSDVPMPDTAPEQTAATSHPQPALTLLPTDISKLADVPLELAMELSRINISIRDLLALSCGTVLTLPQANAGAIDVKIDGASIASGEIASEDHCFGVRLIRFLDSDADERGAGQ